MTTPLPPSPDGLPRILALQRALAGLAFAPEAADFQADPRAFGTARGLGPGDREALFRWRDRLLFYREGVRGAVWEPLEGIYPLALALLARDGALEACRTAFLAARPFQSPFHRDIAATFVGWLADTGWGRERWPALLELAHFELVRILVEHGRDDVPGPEDLHPDPRPGDLALLRPSTQVLAYGHRVAEATLDWPEPVPGPCHLLAARGPDGYVRWRELTEVAAALLVRAQTTPMAEAAAALGLDDGPGALRFLEELRVWGALAGFTDAGRLPRGPDACPTRSGPPPAGAPS
ncbi:MAG TPA: hypothetical protein VK188_11535 [Holophaga sp.]|nr:hypothetical protein [Holophaga sp.]